MLVNNCIAHELKQKYVQYPVRHCNLGSKKRKMIEWRLKTHSLAVYQSMDKTALKIRHPQSCGPFSPACPSASVLFSFFLLQRLQAMFPFRILGDVQQLRQHIEPERNYGFLCWFNFLYYMAALRYHGYLSPGWTHESTKVMLVMYPSSFWFAPNDKY